MSRKISLSKYFLMTLYERLKPRKRFLGGSISPVIMRKLGPPLLAGEPTFCGEDFPSVVFSFTHNALSDVDFIINLKKQPVKQLRCQHVT